MGARLGPGQLHQVTNWFPYHLGKEPQSLSIYMQWNQLFLTLLVYYKCRDLFSSTDQQYMAFVESPQNEDTTILPKMPGPMYCASCVCPSPTSNLRQQFLSWASLWCPWQPHLLMLKCYCRVFFFFFLEPFEMNCWCCSFYTSFNLCRIHSRELTSLNQIC